MSESKIEKLDGNSSIGDIARLCSILSDKLEVDSAEITRLLGEKLGVKETAADSEKLGGSQPEDFVMKADLTLMTTEKMDSDGSSAVKLTYSYVDPINKSIKTTSDIEIEFNVREEHFALPISAIFIEATNSAKISFKNATVLDELPVITDESYSVVVYVSKIGDRWIVNEIKPILDVKTPEEDSK